MRSLRFLVTVTLILLCGVSAAAQAPTKRQPSVQAETETTYVLPDGKQVHSKGRFYRNQFGQVREDSGLGAVIVDTRAGTVTMLVTETKEAHVVRIPASERTPALTHRPVAEPFEEITVEGRKISKARTTGPHGERVEFWAVKELGIVTHTKSELDGMTTVRDLKNISTLEPDPALFMIPPDYTLIELKHPARGLSPMSPPRPGIAGERGRKPGGGE